jgi:hypothetical protein
MDKRMLASGLGGGAMAFGVAAVVAPKALGQVYSITNNADSRILFRLWGTRTFTLGALALGISDEKQLDDLLLKVAALNATDALLAVFAGLRDGAPSRGAALSGSTSAAFAAALLYARSLK